MMTTSNSSEPGWCPISLRESHARDDSPPPPAQVKRWSLVLSAMNIEHRIESSRGGQQLLVHEHDWERAVTQIERYEKENRGWPPRVLPAVRASGSLLVTLSVVFLLASFHNLTRLGEPLPWLGEPAWFQQGSLYAGKVRSGELWRLVTSLTLHADSLHLAGNAVAMTLFIEQLRRHYGSGSAWALFLLSGVLGNLINAFLQPYHHQAVGASTAVFGLLGATASDSFVRHRDALWRRWALPFAAAAALLGLLGTAGTNTDLGAHLWGFCSGLLLGYLYAHHSAEGGRPLPVTNHLLSLICILTIAASWGIALVVSA